MSEPTILIQNTTKDIEISQFLKDLKPKIEDKFEEECKAITEKAPANSQSGEIIEDYPNDFPFPSCLIYGDSSEKNPIHSVWSYDSKSNKVFLITVYIPSPSKWIQNKIRKKK